MSVVQRINARFVSLGAPIRIPFALDDASQGSGRRRSMTYSVIPRIITPPPIIDSQW